MPSGRFYDVTVEIPNVLQKRWRRLPAMNDLSAVKKAYHLFFARNQRGPKGTKDLTIRVKELPQAELP